MANLDRTLVLCFFIIFCVGCVYCETKYIETGTNYTFMPKIRGVIELGDWRYKGNLVVEWEPKTDPTWYGNYKERAHLNTDNGDLTLQVKKEDNGVFKSQIQVGGTLKYSEVTVEVLDPVPVPKVTCTQVDKNVTLLCSVDPSVQAEFTWSGPNKFSHVGKSVDVTRNDDKEDSIYFCTAKNQVSQKEAEFKIKDCPFEEPHKPNVGVIVGTIFGLLGVLAGALVAFFLYKHKKGSRGTPIGNNAELKDAAETEKKPCMENTTSDNESPDNGSVPQDNATEPV
ncbi:hypothetical protein QTP86_026613 [Hemibagrus guttatus]|nr:hypothetical protein QTP86_026613 [Hemibagrus guttatus]